MDFECKNATCALAHQADQRLRGRVEEGVPQPARRGELLVVEFVKQFVQLAVAVEEAVQRGPQEVVAEEEEGAGDDRIDDGERLQAAPDDLKIHKGG